MNRENPGMLFCQLEQTELKFPPELPAECFFREKDVLKIVAGLYF